MMVRPLEGQTMVKKRKPRRRRTPSLTRRLADKLSGISLARLTHGFLSLVMLAGVLAGAAYGLPALEQYVSGLPEYQHELAVELVDQPAWLEANPHVAQAIADRCGMGPEARRLSGGLARRVARGMSLIGWIKQVHEVSIGADDIVRIHCDYREPVAWVAYRSFYYLVDEEQVRLPGRYSHGEVGRDSGLMLVMGVSDPPPLEGQRWAGADVRAAIQMVELLRDKPYFDQLTGVLVDNYGGRIDRRDSHIELATDRGARIRWGRAPGEEIDEPTAAQKLAHLQGIWREYDRVDMGRAWVDIQVWPDRVLVPVSNWQPGLGRRS